MNEINYVIEREIETISTRGSWNLELNLISWNGAPAKYDLRTWNDSHTRMGKGVTFTKDEAVALMETLEAEFERS